MRAQIPVGARVRHSGYALRSLRDFWLNAGEHTRKNNAKAALDKAIAERGTVVEHLPADPKRGVMSGLRIRWDNGTETRCLDYRVEMVEE